MKTTSIITVDSPLGIDQSWSASAPSAYSAVNLRYTSRGSWRESGALTGATTIGPPDPPGSLFTDVTVETVHWWSQHNGARRWTMFEFSHDGFNNMAVLSPKTLEGYVVLEGGRTYIDGPWQRTQYAANGGWVYWFNGYEPPKRWDGRGIHNQRPVQVGFDQRPRPPQVADPNVDFKQEDRTCRPIGFWLGPVSGIDRELDVYIGEATVALLLTLPNWAPTAVPVTVLSAQQRGVGVAHADTFPEPMWRYGYAISYINDLGMESPLSELTFVTGKNDNISGKRQVAVQIGEAPQHVSSIRLYRTANLRNPASSNFRKDDSGVFTYELTYGDSTLQAYSYSAFRPLNQSVNVENEQDFQVFLLESFPSGSSVQYVDDNSDSELGPLFNSNNVGLIPRGAKYVAMFKGTMFLAGAPEYPDRVFFSAALYCEQFPASNFMQIGDRDSGEVTGLFAMENTMVAFKQRAIYLIKGDPYNGYATQTLTEELGCSSPNAVVATPRGLVFVTTSGIHLLSNFDNQATKPSLTHISRPIQKYWDEHVYTQGLMSAQGTVNYKDAEVWIQVPADGNHHPSVGLVWHYGAGRGEWSLREGYPANCFAQSRDEYQHLYVGSWNPAFQQLDGGLRLYSTATGLSGLYPPSKYTTSWLSFGSRYDRTMVIHYQPILCSFEPGTVLLTGGWYAGRDLVETVGSEALFVSNSETAQPTWDGGIWGTSVYGDYRSTIIRFDITREGAPLLAFESAFELASGHGRRFEFIAYDLEVSPSRAPTDIKKLTPAKL